MGLDWGSQDPQDFPPWLRPCQSVSVVLQCSLNAWLKRWLADIRADLREAVAHKRRVRDDALYKSTVTNSVLYVRSKIVSGDSNVWRSESSITHYQLQSSVTTCKGKGKGAYSSS